MAVYRPPDLIAMCTCKANVNAWIGLRTLYTAADFAHVRTVQSGAHDQILPSSAAYQTVLSMVAVSHVPVLQMDNSVLGDASYS